MSKKDPQDKGFQKTNTGRIKKSQKYNKNNEYNEYNEYNENNENNENNEDTRKYFPYTQNVIPYTTPALPTLLNYFPEPPKMQRIIPSYSFKILYRNIGIDRENPFDVYAGIPDGIPIQSKKPCDHAKNLIMFNQLQNLINLGVENKDDFIVFAEFCVGLEKNNSKMPDNLTKLDNLLTNINSYNKMHEYKAILFGYNRKSSYQHYPNDDNGYKCLGIIYDSKKYRHDRELSLKYNLLKCKKILNKSIIENTSNLSRLLKLIRRNSSKYSNIYLIRRHIFTLPDDNYIIKDKKSIPKMSHCIGQYAQIALFHNKSNKSNKLYKTKNIVLANVHYPKCTPINEGNKNIKYPFRCSQKLAIKTIQNFNNMIISHSPVNIILGDINYKYEINKKYTEPKNFEYIGMNNIIINKQQNILYNNFGLYKKNDITSDSANIYIPDMRFYQPDRNYSSHFFHNMEFTMNL